MRKQTLILVPLLFAFVWNAAASTPLQKPIAFVENRGQIHDQNYISRPDVLYGAMVGDMVLYIRNSGVSYQLSRTTSFRQIYDLRTDEQIKRTDGISTYRVDLDWMNCNPSPVPSTDAALPGVDNYYVESCPNGALGVRSFKGISLSKLYTGIDLHYYEKNGDLKHDYLLAPGADYRKIRIKVSGANIMPKQDGGFILITPFGNIEESRPIVYQHGKILGSKWVVKGNVLSFDIVGCNPGLPLIIDPVTRVWATYYGGNDFDTGNSVSTDASGNVYLAGSTLSGSLIATSGSHQQSLNNLADAMLVKFNSFGARLWATYYGGIGLDYGNACATDLSGNVFLGGYSYTQGGLSTSGCHQGGMAGDHDGILVKFNSSGVRQWATYYGSSASDVISSVCTDPSGNVFIGGGTKSTSSAAFTTPGCHQPIHTAGFGNPFEGFVAKFNSGGVRQWGTFYGGSNDDYVRSVCTDGTGNLFFVGNTDCGTGTIIATPGAHQPTHSGGLYDGFLVKFSASGVRQWGTYYGGSGLEHCFSVCRDPSNNIFISGETQTTTGTLVATPGSAQPNHGGGIDSYFAKFTNNGVRMWGTYFGGSGNERNLSSATDGNGNVYFAGFTSTTGSVVASANAYQMNFAGGAYDSYLAGYNANGTQLWSTYYGGPGHEQWQACATDPAGAVYLAGVTSSSVGTEIATVGSHQDVYGGGQWDGYLVKFKDCPVMGASVAVNNNPVCSGENVTFSGSYSATFTPNFSWAGPNGYASTVQNPTVSNIGSNGGGAYILTVHDGTGCSAAAVVNLTVNASPTVAVNSGTICIGDSFTIMPTGATAYTVQGNSYTVTPTATTSYTVMAMSAEGCPGTATSNVTVELYPVITVNSGSVCVGSSFTIVPGGASSYTFSGGSNVVSPTVSSSFTVTGASPGGCVSSTPAISQVAVHQLPTVTVNNGSICAGTKFTISPTGAMTYSYSSGSGTVSPATNTTYSVSGTSSLGCVSAAQATLTVYILKCLGIEDTYSLFTRPEIYPNPCGESLRMVRIDGMEIMIVNSLGQIVYRGHSEYYSLDLEVRSFANGIYTVIFDSPENRHSMKFVKE
jgi:hypothetical protein